MSPLTASMRRAVSASRTGMSIFVSGWRTLMFTLRRRASTIDETCWAMDIICSNSPSMSEESQTGKVERCTDSSVWRPLTAFRSRKIRSEMNGANGAESIETVSRQV